MLEVIFYSLIGGIFSLIGAIVLLKSKKTADGMAKYATPFAAGVLLGAAFIDLLPEALEQANDDKTVLLSVLIGILLFFVLERFISVFHHHHSDQESAHGNHKKTNTNLMVIIGDTMHNALDGVAIAAAFLIGGTSTGVVTVIAVALHEIPQEIGDFGIMLRNGMSRPKVLIVNIASALATTIAAILTYQLGGDLAIVPYLLGITAGFFIYIASSDIIPEIHDQSSQSRFDIRPLLLIAGAVFMILAVPVAHSYIDNGHAKNESHNVCADSFHQDEVKNINPVCSIE